MQFVCGRFVLKWKKDGDFAVLGDGQTLISVLGNPSGTQAAFGGDKVGICLCFYYLAYFSGCMHIRRPAIHVLLK